MGICSIIHKRRQKMEKRVVYLLGAGAMIDFGGPKTCELTNMCIDVLNNNQGEGILSSLDKTYGIGKYNFETIIAAVEHLLDWYNAKEADGYITTEDTNIIRLLFVPHFNFTSDKLVGIYFDLINTIIKRVSCYDTYGPWNNNHNILEKYFQSRSVEGQNKIYSLNYDRLIPRVSQIDFADGTGEKYGHTFFDYNLKYVLYSKCSYINLHGSIYLKMIPDFYYKIEQAFSPQYLGSAIKIKGGSPNEKLIFSPIIAGYSKSQRMLSDPFNFGLGAFMADCNLCDELVIVGYSFSDPHINSIINNYVLSRNVDITIVDKKDASIIEKELMFKFHVVTPFRNDSGTSFNKDEKIKIYSNGFLEYMNSRLEEQQL